MASIAFPQHSKSTKVRDGTRYGYVRIQAKSKKPTLLFLHGFPSSSYDWRHQIAQFSSAGYGLVVPDLLGYGDTDKPSDLQAYDMTKIGQHVVDILHEEALDKVIGIGHDFGSELLSCMLRWHEDCFLAAVFLAVGYAAKLARDIDLVNKVTLDRFGYATVGYQEFHCQQDAARLIDANIETYHSLVYPPYPEIHRDHLGPPGAARAFTEAGKPAGRPSWLSEEEANMHTKIIKKGGYEAPLKWYKQTQAGITAASESSLTKEQRILKLPVLYIGATYDYVCISVMMEEHMTRWVRNLRTARVDAGHWLIFEKKDDVYEILQHFFDEVEGAYSKL